jgi:hypothetical protein
VRIRALDDRTCPAGSVAAVVCEVTLNAQRTIDPDPRLGERAGSDLRRDVTRDDQRGADENAGGGRWTAGRL